ncbi:tonB-system energizer ExbB [Entomomonas asaccharolytica]|nr:tonB-system energizer ExbB [Entomomonas asaccharolytica]
MLNVSSRRFSLVKQLILITTLCFTSLSFAQQASPTTQHEHQVEQSTTVPTTEQATTNTADNEDTQTALTPTVISENSQQATPSLDHDLSPWGMYQNADIVVKAVMIGLLLASLATWTIFIAKLFELLTAKKRLRQEMAALRNTKNLKQANEVANTFSKNSLATSLIDDLQEELELSADSTSHEGIKERAAFRQDRLVAASGRKMNAGTSILATIGAVSPFIGLFGTVWGIMNSFIGIAKSQTTNLAVVAPGIAEALLATAMGLVAAIPAVIIYNVFTRSISHYKVMVSDISAHALLLLSRDLDRKSHTASTATTRSNVTKIG